MAQTKSENQPQPQPVPQPKLQPQQPALTASNNTKGDLSDNTQVSLAGKDTDSMIIYKTNLLMQPKLV